MGWRFYILETSLSVHRSQSAEQAQIQKWRFFKCKSLQSHFPAPKKKKKNVPSAPRSHSLLTGNSWTRLLPTVTEPWPPPSFLPQQANRVITGRDERSSPAPGAVYSASRACELSRQAPSHKLSSAEREWEDALSIFWAGFGLQVSALAQTLCHLHLSPCSGEMEILPYICVCHQEH